MPITAKMDATDSNVLTQEDLTAMAALDIDKKLMAAAHMNQSGQLNEAKHAYQEILQHHPTCLSALTHLIPILKELHHLDEALITCEKFLTLDPDNINVLDEYGNILMDLKKYKEATDSFRLALTLAPHNNTKRSRLLNQLQHVCDWSDLESNTHIIKKALYEPITPDNIIFPFNFLTLQNTTPEEHRYCGERWAKNILSHISKPQKTYQFNRHRDGKIRVGYLSQDFREHATAFLIAEVFELHNRDDFEIIAYSYGPDDSSAMRKWLMETFDNFVDIRYLTDEEAADMINKDNIDILVDLKGYTFNSRSKILALRPSPIQINYLGYPGSMGSDFVDYIIADHFIIPSGYERFYSEKVIFLPHCYQPNDRARPHPTSLTRSEYGLPENGLVFCCFNHAYKITADIFDIWCRLLTNVPNSVLWLLSDDHHAEANLMMEATQRGIDHHRIIFARILPLDKHLARMQCADLFLDTFPVNAHTTCSDALWMGLPIITCAGETFISRVAGSLLTAMNVPELITYNLTDYYNLAFDLATHHQKRHSIHEKIISNRQSTPLFNTPLLTQNLEALYRQVWNTYLDS